MLPFFESSKTNPILENMVHYLVGLTLALKGIDMAEYFNDYPFTVVFLFADSAFIIFGTAFRQYMEKKVRNFTALFHVIGGISLILIGFVLLEKGSRLPYFFSFIGAVYLALGACELFTNAAEKMKLRPPFLTLLGTALLAAAVGTLAINLFGLGKSWAYIMATMLAAIGMFILLVRKRAERQGLENSSKFDVRRSQLKKKPKIMQ